jgi:hypothetical protein
MSPGLTTERVYAVLKAQIIGGERRPGERLDPARLASDLNASTTPVRDALHQLLGERLVEAWPSQGFQVPTLGETALRELYGWHGDLLGLLLRGWKSEAATRPAIAEPAVSDHAEAARVLFEAIAARLGTREHRIAIGQASDRLHRARMAEASVFPDLAAEQDELHDLWCAGRPRDLRTALVRYHRRRQQQVPAIAATMPGGSQT